MARLGLIGGSSSKRTSGLYLPEDNLAREDAKSYLTSFSYDGKFNALVEAGAAQGFAFSPDGRILLACTPGTRTTAKITEWRLTTPFDIATINYRTGRDFLCGDYDISVNSIAPFQSQNGLDFYFSGLTNDTIWQANYNTDVSGPCVLPSVSKFFLGTQDATPRSTRFSFSGAGMFVLGGTSRNVYQYSLSVGFDLTTVSYVSKTLAVTQDATPQDIFFEGDGSKMYMLGGTSRAIYSYTLPNAWDLTGATSDYSAPITYQTSAQAAAPRSVYIGDSGTKMYVLSYTVGPPIITRVFQYTLNIPYDPASAVYTSGSPLTVTGQDTEAWEIFFDNTGSKMYLLGSTNDAIFSYTLSTPWEVSTGTADYVPRSFLVGTQAGVPCNTFIGDNGAKMYVLNQANDTIFQYTLSTPYDVTTAIYANILFSVTSLESEPRGMFFKGDGTKMYVVGITADVIFSYTLTTPWNISTAVADYVSKSYLNSAQTATVSDIFVGDNGTKMYILSGNTATTDTVFQYTLGTAWDVTSASYANKSFSVNTQSTNSSGMFFRSDGTKLYVINDGGASFDIIYQYSLLTAWDISTCSYDNVSFNVSNQEAAPRAVYISPDGVNLYVYGQIGDDVNRYTLGTPWQINTATFVQSTSVLPEASGTTVDFSEDGQRMYVSGITTGRIYEYLLVSPWDISNITLVRGLSIAFLDSLVRGIAFKPDGTKLFLAGDTSDRVHEITLSVPWQITSVQGRFSVADEEISPSSIYISPDGLNLYVTGQTGDDVNQYSLSTAWDTSSATYVRVSTFHGEATPTGIFFKEDGSRMYIVGTTLDTILEFALSVPWNVSTISLDRQRFLGNFDAIPNGIHISPNGLNLYITGDTNNRIYQFELTSAWRSTYIKGFTTVQQEDTAATGMYISPDGLNLYVLGSTGDDVSQYLLDVAWDTASAHYVRVSSNIQEADPRGIFFSDDGTRMHVTGQVADTVREYTLSIPWNVSTALLTDVLYYGHIASFPTALHFSPDGFYMYFVNGTLVYRWTLARAWRSNKVTGMYSVSNEETVPTAFHFNSSGTNLYLTGSTGDDVNLYSLSTAWDITSIVYQSVSVGHGEATPTGITLDEDLGFLYITGTTLDTIRRFAITPGNVSSMVFSASASAQFEATNSGINYEPVADRLFLTGTTNDCVYGLPYDSGDFHLNGSSGYFYIGGSEANIRSISNPASSPSSLTFFVGGTTIQKYSSSSNTLAGSTISQTFPVAQSYGISVSENGKRIYIALGTSTADKGGRAIRVANMTMPFDLSTAILDTVEAIGAPGLLGNPANLWNVYVTPDEMRMFVMSPAVQGIYQFSRRFG